MPYPHSPAETIADGVVHVAGLLLAVPFSALLIAHVSDTDAGVIPVVVYIACMLASFGTSALYHMTPLDGPRPLLRRLDHAAIFLKIAGTYTPLVAVIGSGFAYGVLGVVWALAAYGIAAKLWVRPAESGGSVALYLGMGWLSMLLIWPMWQALGGVAVGLIVGGGLTYSAGTLVYSHPGMRYQNALWHGIVLVASSCFFAAIAASV